MINTLSGFSSIKRYAVLLAFLAILGGGGWNGARWLNKSYDRSSNPMVQRENSGSWARGSRNSVAATHTGDRWADILLSLGISFLVAMAIGKLLRAFLRTMITILVVGGITLYFLSQQGMVDPFWENLAAPGVADWAASEGHSVWTQLRETVPSMGAALVGLGFGLKR
ncbi:MAG: hypothetical protein AAGA96_06055 [Verrucomicrobiota bacterium]